MQRSKQFPLFLALLTLTSFGSITATEAQAKPPDHAPAWGYRCNRGERVNYPDNHDCTDHRDRDDDREADRDDQDSRINDRFYSSLIVTQISNRDLPRELGPNDIFRLIERDRYFDERQVIILRSDGQILQSRGGKTVRIGRISRDEVREFERLLRNQDFEAFDRRSYSSRSDREATTILLSSRDTAVRYQVDSENQLPQQLRRIIDAFERLSDRTSYNYERDRDDRYSYGTLPAGTRLSVEYQNSDRIVLRRNERLDLTLVVNRDVRDSRGTVVIPEGSRIEGELRPTGDGTQFVSDRLILTNGRRYEIDATSDIIKRNRNLETGRLGNTNVTEAARVVLGSITRGGNLNLGTVLGNVLAGRLGQNTDIVVVYPDSDLDLTLRSDLSIR